MDKREKVRGSASGLAIVANRLRCLQPPALSWRLSLAALLAAAITRCSPPILAGWPRQPSMPSYPFDCLLPLHRAQKGKGSGRAAAKAGLGALGGPTLMWAWSQRGPCAEGSAKRLCHWQSRDQSNTPASDSSWAAAPACTPR